MDPNSNINPNPEPATPAPAPEPSPEVASVPKPTPSTPVAPAADKKPLPKKLILIGAAVLVVILLVVLGIIFIPKLSKSDDAKLAEEYFSEDILIAIEQNDKYGYINLNGKMVIQPQFENAEDFQGDNAIVKIKDGETTKNAIIDRKGKILFTAEKSESISYNAETEIWTIGDQIYDKKLKKILPDGQEVYDEEDGYYLVVDSNNIYDGKNTIYNRKGKAVYSYESNSNYWDVTDYIDDFEQAYASLKVGDNNFTIVNLDSGKIVAENLKYDSVWADEYTSFCLYDNGCNKNLIVWNDKVTKEYDYKIDLIYYGEGKNGYYKIYDDSSSKSQHDTEYFDLKTTQISTEAPKSDDSSEDLSEWEIATNSTIFSCSAGYGLMINKAQAIPCEYKHIRTPDTITYEYLKGKGKNYVIGNKDEKSYVLQAKNGKVVTEFNTSYLDFELLSSFVGEEEEDGKYHVYNLATGKSAMIEADRISYNPMYIRIKKSDDKYEYYNKNLKLFYTQE